MSSLARGLLWPVNGWGFDSTPLPQGQWKGTPISMVYTLGVFEELPTTLPPPTTFRLTSLTSTTSTMPDRLKMMAWIGAKLTFKGQRVHHPSKAHLRHSRSMPLRNSSETDYTSGSSRTSDDIIISIGLLDSHSYDPVPDALHPSDCECILCVDRILDEFPTPPPRPHKRPADMMEELNEIEMLPDKVYEDRRRRLEWEQREATRLALISYVCEKYNVQVRDKQRGRRQSISLSEEDWDILVQYHPAFSGQKEEQRRLKAMKAINRSSQSLDATIWLGSGRREEESKLKLSMVPAARKPELVHKSTVASVRPVQVSGLNQSLPEDVASDRSDDDSLRRLKHHGRRNLEGKPTCPNCWKKTNSRKGPWCRLHRHPRAPQSGSVSLAFGSSYTTPPRPVRALTDSVLVDNFRMVPVSHHRQTSDETFLSEPLSTSVGYPAVLPIARRESPEVGEVSPPSGLGNNTPKAIPLSQMVKSGHGGSPPTNSPISSTTGKVPAPGSGNISPSQPRDSQNQKKGVPSPTSVPPKATHLPRATQVVSDSASMQRQQVGQSASDARPRANSIMGSLSSLRRRPAQNGHSSKHSDGSVVSLTRFTGCKTQSSPPRPVNTRRQKPSPLPIRPLATHPPSAQASALPSSLSSPSHKDKPLPQYPSPARVEPEVYEGLQRRLAGLNSAGKHLPASLSVDGPFPRKI